MKTLKAFSIALAAALACVGIYGAGTTIAGTRVVNNALTVNGVFTAATGAILNTPASGDASNLTNIPVANAKSGSVLPGANGGGLVLLEQHTASSSATLNFTTCISSTYDDYIIRFANIIPASSAVDFQFRISTNGGSSYDSSSNYYWGLNYVPNVGAAGVLQGSSVTSISLFTAIDTSVSFGGISGQINLYNPGSAASRKNTTFQVAANQVGATFSGVGSGVGGSATAVNAFQFFFSSGNIASGTIRCYGIAKS